MSSSGLGFNIPPRALGLLLGVFGVVLTVVFVWLLVDTLIFNASANRTEGEVVRNESTEAGPNQASVVHAVVQFRDGERTVGIRTKSGSSTPQFAVGEKVTVLYIPGKAEEGRIVSFAEQYLLLIVFGVLGPGLAIVGGILCLRGLREQIASVGQILAQLDSAALKRHQQALTTGTAVQAKVTEVRIDPVVHVDGRHPWVIVAEYQDEGTGPKMTFTSEPIWFNPEQYYAVGSAVKVYYVPEDPSVYAVALDRIPE